MDNQEKQEILNNLQIYGNMYHVFFNLGNVYFTDEIPRAAINFDNINNNFSLLLNESFWKTLTLNQKTFYISHECLHIMLNHIQRYMNMVNNGMGKDTMEIANIAMDLTINESLVKYYNFIKDEVDPDNSLCWLDTIFPNNTDIQANNNFEYYFELLQQNIESDITICGSSQGDKPSLADEHNQWIDGDKLDKLMDEIFDGMTVEELELLNKIQKCTCTDNGLTAGNAAGKLMKQLEIKKIRKKKKWETIIHKWVKNKIKESEHQNQQWIKLNRRFTTLDRSLILPTDDEFVKLKPEKIDVAFYIDTSPSCRNYTQRFFNAAKSVPLDRFNVRFFGFSTYVQEVDIKTGKLPLGYGTSFSIIETSILKEFKKYPGAVFIVTDGYGNNVSPKIPERWYWFLTEPCYTYVHKNSKRFILTNFE